jgi:arginyl-tRNA synthetase
MKAQIKKIIKDLVGDEIPDFSVEVSDNPTHGDYSTNVALLLAKKIKKNPVETANYLKSLIISDLFIKIEVAGPGFINFFVSNKVVLDEIKKIDKNYGKPASAEASAWSGKKIIIDYTDPNPFKEFHIGHLMSNAIGESLSRIFEFQGAKVKRVCYQGDVGIHVAKAIWGKLQNINQTWGQAYAFGAQKFEENENSKKEIIELNKKIYQRTDRNINKLYDQGKKESLKHFGEIYKKIDTRFDYFIFESQTAPIGKKNVEKGLEKGIFEKGDNGAIIFKGEKFGLHTRVFINSEGLPTYEAKDLALAQIKNKKYKYDTSVVVTGNEVNDYFKVMLKAMEQITPELAEKTKHIGHGMLRLPEGKMSSRTGQVITGESLIKKVQELVKERNKDEEVSQTVAIGAIKYSILKQSIGSDIIYDFDKSVSFDGDSGPYLQYSCARAFSILRKAKAERTKASFKILPNEASQLEKKMCQFPEVVLQASQKYEPHYILLYLTELSSEFNSYYTKNKIVDKTDKYSPYRVALVSAFSQIMKNGLWLLGIKTLEKM